MIHDTARRAQVSRNPDALRKGLFDILQKINPDLVEEYQKAYKINNSNDRESEFEISGAGSLL